jgi:nucleotide-binding universal stress UspA family protein
MGGTVVVGVDGSTRSRAAADWGAWEALRRRLPLYVVHVSELSGTELSEP